MKNIKECCKLVSNVLESIDDESHWFEHNVPEQKKWSYEEAMDMSRKNYRNTYLPSNLKLNTDYNKKKKEKDTRITGDDLPF